MRNATSYLSKVARYLSIVLIATTFVAVDARAQEDYVLGVILANTGPFAVLGQLEVAGAKLRADEINAAGGINGHKIRLEIVDNKSDPQTTVSGVRALLQNNLVGVIGPESTSLSVGIIPIMNEAKIPNISLQGGLDLSGQHGYVFGNQMTGSTIVRASVNHMKAKGITKIGYLTTSDALGQAGDKFGLPVFEASGIQIVGGKQTIDPAGTDFTTQLAAIKAAGAQAVFIWATGSANVVVAKGFQALKMPGQLYLLNMTPEQVKAMGDATSVVRVAQTKADVFDQVKPDDPIYKNLSAFVAAATKHGVRINSYSAVGYGAVAIFEDALRKVGPNPVKIYELWNGGYEPPNTVSRMNWNAEVHQGFRVEDLVITEVLPTGAFRTAP